MKPRVYVAGSSSERATRAKPVIAALSAAGYIITHDWTTSVDAFGANGEGAFGESLTEDELRVCAEDDYDGVLSADIFVLLAPQNASTGAWVELGVALAAGERGRDSEVAIYIAGKCDRCIFTLMNNAQRYETDAALLEALLAG